MGLVARLPGQLTLFYRHGGASTTVTPRGCVTSTIEIGLNTYILEICLFSSLKLSKLYIKNIKILSQSLHLHTRWPTSLCKVFSAAAAPGALSASNPCPRNLVAVFGACHHGSESWELGLWLLRTALHGGGLSPSVLAGAVGCGLGPAAVRVPRLPPQAGADCRRRSSDSICPSSLPVALRDSFRPRWPRQPCVLQVVSGFQSQPVRTHGTRGET